ncbi:MAG TPA: TlpA disulfide reductase family protein [Actinomycetota bacterium]|jgi:peroxiredoxin|nr:TlpA disulfide reductase family protein [Actinomycetota bacterium]
MRPRFALVALAATLLAVAAACAGDPPSGQGPGGPATTAPAATSAPATDPPVTVAAAPETTRAAPKGLIAAGHRKPAPPLQVTDFKGRTHNLAGLRGRPVVVNFFESWCVVCRTEQKDLDEVAGDFEGRVQFLGVSNNDTVSEGRKYQRDFEIPYPLANDASGRTWAAWGVPYQPVTVVVDQQGRVAWRFAGLLEPGMLAPVLEYLVEV